MQSGMTKGEREDLQRLVRQREKVLKSAARQRSAELLADFEKQMGSSFSFDDDATWAQAYKEAEIEVAKAQKIIAQRCRELGIPDRFAPNLEIRWRARGYDNLIDKRKAELRRMATTRIEAIEQKAVADIELNLPQGPRGSEFGCSSRLHRDPAINRYLDAGSQLLRNRWRGRPADCRATRQLERSPSAAIPSTPGVTAQHDRQRYAPLRGTAMSTDLVEEDKRELAGPDAVNHLHLLLLKQWNGLEAFIASARDKARLRRLAIGRTLLELRRLIDSGENGDQCTFWEWFDEMIPGRSRDDARHLMEIARQPDPEVAYQKKLEKQKEYSERHYRKKFGAPSPEAERSSKTSEQPPAEPEFFPPPPKPKTRYTSADSDDELLEEFENIFRRLSWDGRDRGIKRISKLYKDWKQGLA
jgi:hypothetical protein